MPPHTATVHLDVTPTDHIRIVAQGTANFSQDFNAPALFHVVNIEVDQDAMRFNYADGRRFLAWRRPLPWHDDPNR